MGYPQYLEILKGDLYDERVRSKSYAILRNNIVLLVWSHWVFELLFIAIMIDTIK